MKDKILCYKCGRQMQMVMDTPLCPVCDRTIIYIRHGWVKKDVENTKRKNEKR